MQTKLDFIGGNTKRCLTAMALPMIAAMFLNMMYNLVDSLWIGNLLGETAYAALTNFYAYHSDFDLGCDGGNERYLYPAFSGHRRKRQGKDGAPDLHVVLYGSRVFAACNRFAGSASAGNFESPEYPGGNV